MARYFRFYGKKRGDRRTGSKALGNLGLTLFFATFLVGGLGLFALLVWQIVLPEWRVKNHFVEGRCIVLKKRLGERPGSDPVEYRPEICIQYEVKDRTYERWTYDITMVYSPDREQKQAIIDRYVVGQQYACWYDPDHPAESVLVQDTSWFSWLVLLLPLSFVVTGGGGLAILVLGRGKSAERRAAAVLKAPSLDLFDSAAEQSREFPHVPRYASLTDSPGTTLAYRLPLDAAPLWALIAGMSVAGLGSLVAALFFASAVQSHLRGEHDWMLTVFSLPALSVGLLLVVYFGRQLFAATGVGLTLVEISDHPLYPGQDYQIYLSQSGRLKMNSLQVLFVCEEKATYRQGTNTRTEVRRVHQEELYCQEGFEIRQGLPFDARLTLHVPCSGMHSFKAEYNEVNWRLIVKGNVAGWPDFERRFPVLVYPRVEETPA